MKTQYLSNSKQKTLQVFWVILAGGIEGKTAGQLKNELDFSESSLYKELQNLAAANYIERRRTNNYAVSAQFIEQFAAVIRSMGVTIK